MELGIGMTLYFRQLKLFTIMFFVFTILSIPQFLIYYNSYMVHQSQYASDQIKRIPQDHYLTYYKDKYLFPLMLPYLGFQDFFCYSVPIGEIIDQTVPNVFEFTSNRTLKENKKIYDPFAEECEEGQECKEDPVGIEISY